MAATTRVFVTGATGALGAAATAALVRAGHEVHGMARSEEGRALVGSLGAVPVEVDLFDAQAVAAATRGCDAIVHLATRIPEGAAMARMRSWRENDRLRLEGTRHLVVAAEANGISRVVFESLALAYPDRGDAWIDEDEPLAPVVPVMRSAVEAEAMLRDFGRRGGGRSACASRGSTAPAAPRAHSWPPSPRGACRWSARARTWCPRCTSMTSRAPRPRRSRCRPARTTSRTASR